MPGPAGEQCSLCYYYEAIDDTVGYCRFENGDLWIDRPGTPAISAWPRVRGELDWSGDYRAATGGTGNRATGAFVTPTGTTFSITDTVNYIKYDPGNLLEGAIMLNVTLTDGVLAWDIPGTYPGSATWEVFISVYGSVTFPDPTTFLDISVGTGGVPYSNNTLQKLQVNPTTDDISLAFSLQGLAPATQAGEAEMLVRGDIGDAFFTSAVMQLDVTRAT